MSKGIIVVDKIPENCRNIRGEKEKGCPFGGMVYQIKQEDVMKHIEDGTKPDWCPRTGGWNASIDEILGKE